MGGSTDINQQKASREVIKPHAALQKFTHMPDAITGQTRGIALIDKMDQLLAEDELRAALEELNQNNDQSARLKVNAAQMKVALVTERIDQRTALIPDYNKYIEELHILVNQLQTAVEHNEFSIKENIPFYRLLRAQVVKKA